MKRGDNKDLKIVNYEKSRPIRYDVIFKKAFSHTDIFTALVKDFLDIQLEIDEVKNDKVFVPSVGNVAIRFDLFAEDKKIRLLSKCNMPITQILTNVLSITNVVRWSKPLLVQKVTDSR